MRFLLLPTLLLAATFSTADLDAHRKWMDDAQDKKDDIRAALDAKDIPALQTATKALEELTAREQAFWARTSLKQAQEIAAKNRNEARELVQAAKAARVEDSAKVFASVEKTCSSCHDLHFEKHPSMAPSDAPKK